MLAARAVSVAAASGRETAVVVHLLVSDQVITAPSPSVAAPVAWGVVAVGEFANRHAQVGLVGQASRLVLVAHAVSQVVEHHRHELELELALVQDVARRGLGQQGAVRRRRRIFSENLPTPNHQVERQPSPAARQCTAGTRQLKGA